MNRIKELRTKKGWRQEDLAMRMNTTQESIGRYENEKRGLDIETINILCDLFGVSADYLLCRSDMPSPLLTPEEWEILAAWRKADDRAQSMVRLALDPWIRAQEEEKAL